MSAPARTRGTGLAGAAALVAVLTVLSRAAGAGRAVVLAHAVPGCAGGTWTAANAVPTLLFEVVAGGALAGLVVPVLAGGIAAGDADRVRATASALLGWALVVLVPLAVAVAALAGPLARLVLGGDTSCPGSTAFATRLLVVLAPQVLLYGPAVVLTGVLQAHRRFAGPAVAPLVSSAVVVAGSLLYAALGGGASAAAVPRAAETALAVGTTLGVAALALVLVPPLRRLGLGLRPSLRFPPGAAAPVRRLAGAGLVPLAAQQVAAAVALRLAGDGAPPGTQLVLAAATTVFLLPGALLAVPLATSAAPVLAGAAATGDEAGYRRALGPVAVVVLTGSAVAGGLLAAAAGPLAGVFFPDAGAAAAMRAALLALVPALPGWALLALLTRALYARGLVRAPAACAAGGWLLAVGADLLLARLLPAADRAAALGLGQSAGVTAAGVALAVVTVRTAGRAALAGVREVAGPALGAGLAGAAAGLGVLASTGGPGAGELPAAAAALLAGGAALAAAAGVLGATARAPLAAAVRALRGAGRG